jgi:hypothetical protein
VDSEEAGEPEEDFAVDPEVFSSSSSDTAAPSEEEEDNDAEEEDEDEAEEESDSEPTGRDGDLDAQGNILFTPRR